MICGAVEQEENAEILFIPNCGILKVIKPNL